MPKFNREVEIKAPLETVWSVLTNPRTWSHWFPGVDAVTRSSGSGQGATFDWRDDERKGTGQITHVEPHKRLEVMTQLGDDRDLHIFEVKPDRGFLGLGDVDGCEIEYTLDTLMGGGILANFIAGGNPKDAVRVKQAMNKLKDYIEQEA